MKGAINWASELFAIDSLIVNFYHSDKKTKFYHLIILNSHLQNFWVVRDKETVTSQGILEIIPNIRSFKYVGDVSENDWKNYIEKIVVIQCPQFFLK